MLLIFRWFIVTLPLVMVGCSSAPRHNLGQKHHHDHHHKMKKHAPQAASKATKHPHSGGIHHSFSDARKWAKMFDDPKRVHWQKPSEVIQIMKIKKGMSVADIGAGTGYFLPYLDRAVGLKGQIFAMDIEQNLIDHMKKRIIRQRLKSSKAILIDPDKPQLKPKSFDRILVVDTWHHIADRENYGKILRSSLKPGGEIVIVDFEPGVKGPGPSQKHRLKSSLVETELKAAGFRTETVSESLTYQYIVIGRL